MVVQNTQVFFSTLVVTIIVDCAFTRQLNPEFNLVYIGEPVHLHCVSFTLPRFIRDGKEVNTSDIESVGVNFYLSIGYAKESDSGTYWCLGTNENRQPFREHSEVIVGVERDGLVRPRKHYVNIDGNVSFTCGSHYTPTWVFNGHHLPANAVVDDIDTNVLHISNAIPGNYGFYYCIGLNGISHNTFISKALLEVLDNRRIFPGSQKVTVGKAAVILCDSKTYTIWKFQKKMLENNRSSQFEDIQSGLRKVRKMLVIDDAKFSDEGVYKCTGTNEYAERFSALSQLLVIEKKKRFHYKFKESARHKLNVQKKNLNEDEEKFFQEGAYADGLDFNSEIILPTVILLSIF